MKQARKHNISTFLSHGAALLLLAAAAMPLPAWALPASHYASSSALAEGRWVKVKTGATGMHLVTNTQLRNMGFSDPSKVRSVICI